MDLRLQRFDDARLPDLMGWFPDAASCGLWGGPHFRYPYTTATFREDTGIDARPAWMLVTASDEMVAFGQVYARNARCHLGHLVVAPARRRLGIGKRLILQLCVQGTADLGFEEYSLFVLPGNVGARALYEGLGFRRASYPEPLPGSLADTYMIATGDAARALRTVD